MAEPLKTLLIEGLYWKKNCFPTLNDLLSQATRSPFCYNKLKKELEEVVRNEIIKQLGNWKAPCRVRLDILYGEKNKGALRDLENCDAAARKIISDALVKSEVLVDDNPKYLGMGFSKFVYVDNPFIKIHFMEIDSFKK